jgi:NAD(P)H-hydrate epimerase
MIGAEPPMSGASVLAARAALRAGTGKVVLTLPTTTASLMSAQLPECIIPVVDAEHALPEQWLKAAHVIAIGPGLGQSEQAANRLREVLALETTKPLILDADALNVLANNAAVQWTPGVRVLTPHPLEMTRLLKRFAPHAVEANELTQVQQLAQALDAIVVRKGAVSWIAEPKGRVLVIDFGGPELALPGSGDVLTGIIAAILAQTRQTIPLIERVALAVSVHALAGQTLYQQFSDGHLASELCDAIPHALDHLRNLNTKTYNLTLRRHIRSTQVSI